MQQTSSHLRAFLLDKLIPFYGLNLSLEAFACSTDFQSDKSRMINQTRPFHPSHFTLKSQTTKRWKEFLEGERRYYRFLRKSLLPRCISSRSLACFMRVFLPYRFSRFASEILRKIKNSYTEKHFLSFFFRKKALDSIFIISRSFIIASHKTKRDFHSFLGFERLFFFHSCCRKISP